MLSFLASIYLFVGLIYFIMFLVGWCSFKKEGTLSPDESGVFFFTQMAICSFLVAPAELLLDLLNKLRTGHKE